MANPAVILAKQPTHAVVGRAYEAMVSGTPQAIEPFLAEDAEFWFRGEPENVPFAGVFTGRQAVRRFLELYSANVRNSVFRPRHSMFHEESDNLVSMLFVLEEGIAAPTGKRFSSESVHEWRLDRAGHIKRFISWNNSFDFFQAFNAKFDASSMVFRHPLEDALITPTRACAANPGAVVEQFYRSMLSEQWERVIDLLAPDVISTLEGVESVVPFAGTFRGKEQTKFQALTFAQNERNVYDNLVSRYVVEGNRVCARFEEAGTYVFATGCAQYFTNIHCFSVNDAGLIEAFRSYNDTWRVWLTVLPEEQRPPGVSLELWHRHRYKPGHPPNPA
jgi:ketosteroid isomerase-like protein